MRVGQLVFDNSPWKSGVSFGIRNGKIANTENGNQSELNGSAVYGGNKVTDFVFTQGVTPQHTLCMQIVHLSFQRFTRIRNVNYNDLIPRNAICCTYRVYNILKLRLSPNYLFVTFSRLLTITLRTLLAGELLTTHFECTLSYTLILYSLHFQLKNGHFNL